MSSDGLESAPGAPERSLSFPSIMDRGLSASKFPPVLVMSHPSMKALAGSLVKTVNDHNQVLDNGKVVHCIKNYHRLGPVVGKVKNTSQWKSDINLLFWSAISFVHIEGLRDKPSYTYTIAKTCNILVSCPLMPLNHVGGRLLLYFILSLHIKQYMSVAIFYRFGNDNSFGCGTKKCMQAGGRETIIILQVVAYYSITLPCLFSCMCRI